ncbi:hypothetical protein IGI04_029996 [Brassica rapa subsp. trilocularis]|uniref:DUF641 domain-containing protein n=1 Tax=Brassica rapa subsp. trilocularis TaxID=1813537 RepID=A0ABQ7LPE3_BRACM|nr:hypothetical protein IGI04_029996 [Brassica rapa subsp. trilocularis]
MLMTHYRKEPNFQYQNNYQQKPFYNNHQSSYQSKPIYHSPKSQAGSSNSAPQESTTDLALKQIFKSQVRQEKTIGDELKKLHTKVDWSYTDLNNKFSNLASNFKVFENQFSSMTSTSKDPIESLPGKSEQSPKEYCYVILSTTSFEFEVEHKVVERVEIRAVEMADEKVVQPVRHKAENPVIGKVVRFLTKAQNKVISKFRKDIGM